MTVADAAIAVCHTHLTSTKTFNTEVESYLVKYLLVLICSEFEEMLETLVEARAGNAGDEQLLAFVKSATAQLLRSLGIGELAGFLARFGPAVKEAFSAKITNTSGHAAFDTIASNRKQVAHTTGTVNLTLPELQARYEESKEVIRQFAAALKLKSPV